MGITGLTNLINCKKLYNTKPGNSNGKKIDYYIDCMGQLYLIYDYITAMLIDKCGLKGYNVGDAYVSDLHAGFIVNKGNATAKDVLELIEYIKKRVYEEFNKKIELEIEIVGED